MSTTCASVPGSAGDRGSSTAEYSLVVAALAAALVAVIMAAGAIARDGVLTTCSSLGSHLAVAGDCSPASTSDGSDLGVATDDT